MKNEHVVCCNLFQQNFYLLSLAKHKLLHCV